MRRLRFPVMLIVLTLGWLPTARGGDAFFIYSGGSDANTGKSWAQALLTPEVADDSCGTGDTLVFKPNDTLYDCSFDWPPRTDARYVTLFCDSTYYENADGDHYSPYGPGANPPVLYGGHDVVDDAGDPENAWTQYSGNVYTADWTEVVVSTYSGGGSGVYVGVQNHDSMLFCVSSIGGVDEAGKYYYDDGGDVVYAWKYGGGDPDGTPMVFSRAAVFDHRIVGGDSASHSLLVTGLDIRAGTPGTVFWKDDPMPDYCTIQHSHISRSGNQNGENPANIAAMNWMNGKGTYNTVRACSLGWAADQGSSGTPLTGSMFSHGGSMTLYSQEHFTAESCFVYGWSQSGIDFKCDGDYGFRWPFVGNVIKFCVFKIPTPGYRWGRYASRTGVAQKQDSIYGNIYVGAGVAVDHHSYSTHMGANYDELTFVANNTFYDCQTAMWVEKQRIAACRDGNVWMYNIIEDWDPTMGFNSGDVMGWDNSGSAYHADSACIVDSGWTSNYNAFHDSIDAFTFSGISGDPLSVAQWRDETPYPDSQSQFSSTGGEHLLTDPANGDYSPTSFVPSMSMEYGGRTWTKYGALQPSDCPNVVLTGPADEETVEAWQVDLVCNITLDTDDDSVIVYFIGERGDASPEDTIRQDTLLVDSVGHTYNWSGLTEDSTYYWKVIVADTSCEITSAIRQFTVDSLPPVETCPSVALVTPVDDSTIEATSIELICDITLDGATDSAIVYFIGERGNPTPGDTIREDTLLIDSTGHLYNWSGLTEDSTYYWKVIVADTSCADTSAIRKFLIDAIPEATAYEIKGIGIIRGVGVIKP